MWVYEMYFETNLSGIFIYSTVTYTYLKNKVRHWFRSFDKDNCSEGKCRAMC